MLLTQHCDPYKLKNLLKAFCLIKTKVMNTDKSTQECHGGLYNNRHKQPDYLSGKIIDGLNGKLFNTHNLTAHPFQSSSKETDFNRE